MRFAPLAILLLLSLGCGHDSPGTPAAESPHVATTPDKAPPGPEPATPPNPLSGAAAKPVPDATTPSLPAAPIAPIAPTAPIAAVAETRRDATPSGTTQTAAEQPNIPQAEAKPVVPARSRPEPSPAAASAAAPDAAPDAGRAGPSGVPAAAPRGAATLPAAAAPVAEPVAPAVPEPVVAPPAAARADLPAPPGAAVPEMDLKALEDQLRQTKAIGFMTKLTLKGQVDDLLGRFRDHYRGKTKESMKDLRRAYDLLMMKVLSLIQDADQRLASAIVASREAIWGLLADPVKFETLQG